MTPAHLPDLLNRGSAIVILALASGMIAVHTTLAALAVRKGTRSARPALLPAAIAAYLTLWFGLAVTVGDRANFPLEREDLRLWISLAVGFGPMWLAIALLFTSRVLRDLIAGMPSAWLIWAQSYRMAGLIFIFPFLSYGIVPAAFAIPAGLGDFVTGALAPFVGRAVAERRRHAIAWAVAWNAFGVLDLIVAPTAAVMSGAQVIGLYPLSLVALFIGPPLGILTHVYSLRNLATASAALGDASPHAPGAHRGRRATNGALRTT
jgi:VIT1/CCC1 family predicted Fe2+/Mn2+ transporter